MHSTTIPWPQIRPQNRADIVTELRRSAIYARHDAEAVKDPAENAGWLHWAEAYDAAADLLEAAEAPAERQGAP